ncbi:hypothetical protein DL98DRAFT_508270 [Cadophora sp. DSE1049]|nr:hypothetical protein DL98DRAFT_508270 [Cadophora sp. DSE1049]
MPVLPRTPSTTPTPVLTLTTNLLITRDETTPQPNPTDETIPFTQHTTILTNLTTSYNTIGLLIILGCLIATLILLTLYMLTKLWYIYHPKLLIKRETAALQREVRRFMRLRERRRVRAAFEELQGRTGRDVGEQVEWVVRRVVDSEMERERR